MVGWHHRLDGHEFDQAPGDGEGQGSLACCSPQGGKDRVTEQQQRFQKMLEKFHSTSFSESSRHLGCVFSVVLKDHWSRGYHETTLSSGSGSEGHISYKLESCVARVHHSLPLYCSPLCIILSQPLRLQSHSTIVWQNLKVPRLPGYRLTL